MQFNNSEDDQFQEESTSKMPYSTNLLNINGSESTCNQSLFLCCKSNWIESIFFDIAVVPCIPELDEGYHPLLLTVLYKRNS